MATFNRILVYGLIYGVAAYALLAYALWPIGAAVHPDMRTAFEAHSGAIYLHVFTSVLAMALGPLQFSTRLRRTYPALHRWSGRIYLGVGVLAGGLSGLYIAQFAHGGLVSQLGFSALALLWLYTGLRAYRAIRQRKLDEHRRWMVRNYALTLAALTLRLYVPLALLAQLEFALAYSAIAWLCWVPNLLLAEWRFVRARS